MSLAQHLANGWAVATATKTSVVSLVVCWTGTISTGLLSLLGSAAAAAQPEVTVQATTLGTYTWSACVIALAGTLFTFLTAVVNQFYGDRKSRRETDLLIAKERAEAELKVYVAELQLRYEVRIKALEINEQAAKDREQASKERRQEERELINGQVLQLRDENERILEENEALHHELRTAFHDIQVTGERVAVNGRAIRQLGAATNTPLAP